MIQFTEISFRNPKFRKKSPLSQIIKAWTQLLGRLKVTEFRNKTPEARKGLGIVKLRSGRLTDLI